MAPVLRQSSRKPLATARVGVTLVDLHLPKKRRICPKEPRPLRGGVSEEGAGRQGYWTTTVPCMRGWMVQKYLNVPASLNVNLKLSSVSSAGDLKSFAS